METCRVCFLLFWPVINSPTSQFVTFLSKWNGEEAFLVWRATWQPTLARGSSSHLLLSGIQSIAIDSSFTSFSIVCWIIFTSVRNCILTSLEFIRHWDPLSTSPPSSSSRRGDLEQRPNRSRSTGGLLHTTRSNKNIKKKNQKKKKKKKKKRNKRLKKNNNNNDDHSTKRSQWIQRADNTPGVILRNYSVDCLNTAKWKWINFPTLEPTTRKCVCVCVSVCVWVIRSCWRPAVLFSFSFFSVSVSHSSSHPWKKIIPSFLLLLFILLCRLLPLLIHFDSITHNKQH